MSYTLSVGSDGSATTAEVVWSVNGQTYRFRSDNNFLSWITTIFEVADSLNIIGGLDLLLTDQIPPVMGGAGNIFTKYDIAGSVAGNARGTGAVDFQQFRNNATEVASGNNSVIGGGASNTASANYATVGGGFQNTASGYRATVGGGYNNTASGDYATVGGGQSNTASGDNATVGGGNSNTASANYATVGGGRNNTASAYYATVGGGRYNTASANYATVGGGFQGLADRYGMSAHASGQFGAQGDAQAVEFVLRNTTTDTTPAVLFLDGSSTRLTIRADTQLSGICTISGIKSDGSEVALYQRSIAIKNIGGTTTLVHVSTISTDHEDDPAWAVAVTADNTNDALQIECTGDTGDNVRWVAVFRGLEIAIG